MRPAQHYTMGGVRTLPTGESPTLKGLFAAGEAACWDMHGFNRLGGNSVAETVVAGMIVGESIADFCDRRERWTSRSAWSASAVEREQAQARRAAERQRQARTRSALKARMQEIMTDKVGIFRTRRGAAVGGRRTAAAAGAQPQHRRARTRRSAPTPSW